MLDRLLGESAATFVDDSFLIRPFSQPDSAEFLKELGTWDRVESMLDRPELDVLVCKQGQRWEQEHRPTRDEARRLFAEGYTLLIRHAEQHDDDLQQLADQFQRDFAAPVNVHVYCTPAGEFGFGWHYDAEEVFIIQTLGEKEYSLRKNTVNPWPTEETLPDDMHYERELMPLMQCLLAAGDWLYIPNGYWHKAEAQTDAISLAVGVMMPPAVSLLDFLHQRLLNSILWRQRLPLLGEAATLNEEELRRQFAELFTQLGDDLKQTLNDPNFLEAYLKRIQSRKMCG